jgi:hypothetical protein
MAQRPGGEKRGNSKDRRARKLWMLSEAAGFGGDGTKVPCVHCGTMLTYETVEADRIVAGGSYRRDNVQPADRACNLDRSNKSEWSYANSKLVVA